jgi:hypothetical protein
MAYSATNSGPPMVPTGEEYFGPEQHHKDLKEIVANQTNPIRVIGKFQGVWDGELEAAVPLATKVTLTKRAEHNDYLYITPLSTIIPKINNMPKILGLPNPSNAQIQMQRPGCCFSVHRDPPSMFPTPDSIRILITLAPWEYGQYMFFNNTVFKEWEAGTIIYSDLRNVFHSTCNTSFHTRPILSITSRPSKRFFQILENQEFQTFNV